VSRRAVRSAAATALLLLPHLGGCAASRSAPPADAGPAAAAALAGTEWKLVELQSMSDEIGNARPDDPSRYTMSFAANGTVSLRLNCNEGHGTWSATPSSDGRGRLEFGPIATTRMLCPPPSLDERIAAELAFVRSYTREGRRLYLGLMADGGIQVWESP